MEKELEKDTFDFTKKLEKSIDDRYERNNTILKKVRFVAFLALGGLSVGAGFGMTNGAVEVYKISQESKIRLAEIQAKNHELLKAKKIEVDAQAYAKQVEADAKEAQIKKAQDKQLALENDKRDYDVWLKNKDSVLANYESQVNIYDKTYQNVMQGVRTGVLGLDNLGNVRQLYQDYKRSIFKSIQFIEQSTSSFENFRNLNEENRKLLNEEIIDYQNGSLHRNSDLENMFIAVMDPNSNDNEKIAKLRKDLRNQIIDDLADVMNNNNETTKVKKLKM
jgi:hypothetical protein